MEESKESEEGSEDRLINEVIYLATTCQGLNTDIFDEIAAAIPKAKERAKEAILFRQRENEFFERIRVVINTFYASEKCDLYSLRVNATDKGLQIDAQTKPKV